MKAPDKIYVEVRHPFGNEFTEMLSFESRGNSDDVEYIRKDFLLEWAKNTKESVENNKPFNDVKMGFVSGVALLIDKLNSL